MVGLLVFGSKTLGSAVQSILSLTISLITNWLTVVTKVFSNILIFFLQKNVSSFAKATHIFSAKSTNVFAISQDRNFNVMLVKNFVKF